MTKRERKRLADLARTATARLDYARHYLENADTYPRLTAEQLRDIQAELEDCEREVATIAEDLADD